MVHIETSRFVARSTVKRRQFLRLCPQFAGSKRLHPTRGSIRTRCAGIDHLIINQLERLNIPF